MRTLNPLSSDDMKDPTKDNGIRCARVPEASRRVLTQRFYSTCLT